MYVSLLPVLGTVLIISSGWGGMLILRKEMWAKEQSMPVHARTRYCNVCILYHETRSFKVCDRVVAALDS